MKPFNFIRKASFPEEQLISAAREGDIGAIRSVLPQVDDYSKDVALGYAVFYDQIMAALYLLQNGANPNGATEDISTVRMSLNNFNKNQNYEMTKLLFDHGAKANLSHLETILFNNNDKEFIKLVLENTKINDPIDFRVLVQTYERSGEHDNDILKMLKKKENQLVLKNLREDMGRRAFDFKRNITIKN